MGYWITLGFLIVFYIIGVFSVDRIKIKEKYVNLIFSLTIFLSYLYCVIHIYNSVGANDWNFLNTLPVANVSPFMYVLTFASLFFPKVIRKYVYSLISLLSLAMFFAGLLSCVGYILRDYAFHFTIALDAFVHVLLSLYGVYLVKSKQVDVSERNSMIISGSIIVGVAILMLILNLIFRTSFFGLSLYGDHNIYNFVLIDNGVASALVYFMGLSGLLFVGYYFQRLLVRKHGR